MMDSKPAVLAVTRLQHKVCSDNIVLCLKNDTSNEIAFCCPTCSMVWWSDERVTMNVPIFAWKLAGE
jgi:hypothetical protein